MALDAVGHLVGRAVVGLSDAYRRSNVAQRFGRFLLSCAPIAYRRSDVGATCRAVARCGRASCRACRGRCSDAYRRSDVGRNLSGGSARCGRGICRACRGVVRSDAYRRSDVAQPVGRFGLMLTDVQTWRNLSGVLVELCAHCLQAFRRGAQSFGRWLSMRSGHLVGACRGGSV